MSNAPVTASVQKVDGGFILSNADGEVSVTTSLNKAMSFVKRELASSNEVDEVTSESGRQLLID